MIPKNFQDLVGSVIFGFTLFSFFSSVGYRSILKLRKI